MKNFLTYFLLKLISIFFVCLPRVISIKIGHVLGLLIYFIYPKRKQIVKSNLKIAFPNKTKQDLEKLIKKVYIHYTILIIEFLRQRRFNPKKIKIHIDEKTKEILSIETGQIFMTAHIGNWEMSIPILNQFKKIAAVVRIQNNSGGDKFIQESRQFNNTKLISMRGSKKEMMKSLINGKILILASDQNAKHRGTKVNFFNKDTSVPKGAAYFHYKTKCPIIVGFCILNKDYTYDFKLRTLDINNNNDIDKTCIDVNTKYSLLLEQQIKDNPEQYFWFHKKWG